MLPLSSDESPQINMLFCYYRHNKYSLMNGWISEYKSEMNVFCFWLKLIIRFDLLPNRLYYWHYFYEIWEAHAGCISKCTIQFYVEKVDFSKCPHIINVVNSPEQWRYFQNLCITTHCIYAYICVYI